MILGSLCAKGHEYESTGKSLRHKAGHCAECFKLARVARMADPEKRASEKEKRRLMDAARRPRKGLRDIPPTESERRERGRIRKARQRVVSPDSVRAYARAYYAQKSLMIRIRNRVSKALRRQRVEKVLTVAGYGIDIPAIALHLGPCPGAPSEWHIDHIRPLASFDMSDPAQVREAFSPSNHQWLTAFENISKGAKYG